MRRISMLFVVAALMSALFAPSASAQRELPDPPSRSFKPLKAFSQPRQSSKVAVRNLLNVDRLKFRCWVRGGYRVIPFTYVDLNGFPVEVLIRDNIWSKIRVKSDFRWRTAYVSQLELTPDKRDATESLPPC